MFCQWGICQKFKWIMIFCILTWLSFSVLIFVVVKFFVLFWLNESFLHQTVLKLTLIGLLGVFWSCYLWKYFPWEYKGVYWCFLCVSWSSDRLLSFMELYMLWEEAQKMRLSNVRLECDSALVCVVFIARTNIGCVCW